VTTTATLYVHRSFKCDRQADRQTERQTDRQTRTNRPTDRQTDGQRERQKDSSERPTHAVATRQQDRGAVERAGY